MLRKFWVLIGVGSLALFQFAIVAIFSILGSDLLSEWLKGLWPNGYDWVNQNPKVYFFIWGLVVLLAWVYNLYRNNLRELIAARGVDADLPLEEAIHYIQKTKRKWRNVPPINIRKQIEQLAFAKKITAWGRLGVPQMLTAHLNQNLVLIDNEFFYSVHGGATKDNGYFLAVRTNLPSRKSAPPEYNSFYQITVNRRQVAERFSRLKPSEGQFNEPQDVDDDGWKRHLQVIP